MSIARSSVSFFLRVLGCGLVVSSVWAAADASPSVEPFATGGGVEITRTDVDAEMQRIPAQVRPATVIDPSALEILTKNLYLRRALTHEAEAAGIDKTPEVAAALRLARERVLSEVWVDRAEGAALPDDAALEAYARTVYKADAQRFTVPEQWHASHILVAFKKPEDEESARARAQKLLDELKAGADFATLAREHSDDPGSGAKGGDLGSFPKGRMVKPFEEALMALKKPGDMSDLVKSQFGFHIIKLQEHQAAHVRPFEEVRDQLVDEARARLRGEQRQRVIDAAMKDAQLNHAAIEALAKENKASQPDIPLSEPKR